MDNNKGPRILNLILIILLILTIAGNGYLYAKGRKTNSEKQDLQKQVTELQKQLAEKSKTTQEVKEETTQETTTETAACESTLTTTQKEAIKLWKAMDKESYSFQYPETWKTSTDEENLIILKTSEASIEFKFKSAEKAIAAIGKSYKKDDTKTVTVACEEATSNYYSSSNNKIITTEFSKNGTKYMVTIYYVYSGASISSDIVEAYDLILKTIEFK